MSGMAQLAECVATILVELRELRAEVKRSRGDEDMTRPLTAEELCERWRIEADTEALQLLGLRRRCEAFGLRTMKGGRGWDALYARDAVLHAEAVASGKINRRRNA